MSCDFEFFLFELFEVQLNLIELVSYLNEPLAKNTQ